MSESFDLTFEKIRENFLNGRYVYDTDEYVEFGQVLHSKLPTMEDLVPLLTSCRRSCQRMGVFIASLEGSRACSIFDHVFALLESPYVDIRDDVCDCFTACAKPEQFAELVRHLDDPDEPIRVKVIQVFTWLEMNKVIQLDAYLREKQLLPYVSEGILLLKKEADSVLSGDSVEMAISKGPGAVKKFAYIAAFRKFGDSEELSRLVNLSNDPDIRRHHRIFIEEMRDGEFADSSRV